METGTAMKVWLIFIGGGACVCMLFGAFHGGDNDSAIAVLGSSSVGSKKLTRENSHKSRAGRGNGARNSVDSAEVSRRLTELVRSKITDAVTLLAGVPEGDQQRDL